MTGPRNSTSREVAKLEAAMEERPPVIQWTPNGRGVMVATFVDDPYRDTGYNRSRTHCNWGHELTEDTLIVSANGRDCRICKRRRSKEYNARKNGAAPVDVRETALLMAARAEI